MKNLWKLIPVLISAAILSARGQSFTPSFAVSLPNDNKHYVVFDKVGEMAASTTIIHVMLSLNLTEFEEDVLKMNKSMNSVIDKLYSEEKDKKSRDKLTNVKATINKRIKMSANKVKLLDRILPDTSHRIGKREAKDRYPPPLPNVTTEFLHMSHPHIQRHKRQVEAAVFGLAATGTFMGIYNAIQLSLLSSQLTQEYKHINLLVGVTNEHTEELKKLTQYTEEAIEELEKLLQKSPCLISTNFNHRLVKMEERTTKLVNMVQQLQHRRLSVDWLTVDQLNLLHNRVLGLLKAKNYHPLVKKVSDYYQLEVSYLRKDEGVIAILHVPAMVAPMMMNLYRYIPFPIPQTEKSNFVSKDLELDGRDETHALFVKAQAELIAIDSKNRYRIIKETDFASCTQHDKIFLCNSGEVIKKNLMEDCMGAMFLREKEAVKKHCQFEMRPIKEEIFRVNHHDYMVYSPTNYVTQIVCKNKTSHAVSIGKVTKLHIPSSCTIKLQTNIIKVEEDFGLYLPSHVASWEWDIKTESIDIINNNHNTQIQIEKLSTTLYQMSKGLNFNKETDTAVINNADPTKKYITTETPETIEMGHLSKMADETPILEELQVPEDWSFQNVLFYAVIVTISLVTIILLVCLVNLCLKYKSFTVNQSPNQALIANGQTSQPQISSESNL
jgi:hypothetical protein